MSNRTDPAAKSIRGTNPQNLVEKSMQWKIFQNSYWKKQCSRLTAEMLVDEAMELDHIGGSFGGNRKPTPFMCLLMKMLHIQPGKDIVVEFIKNKDFKYVSILGAYYLRLTGTDVDIYRYLEPLYNDYRKLKQKLVDGRFSLTHVDEVIDEILTKEYSCDIALPRIKKRWNLVTVGALEPRKSILADEFESRGRRINARSRRYRDAGITAEPKKKKQKKDDGTDLPDQETAEANRIRASIGLKPLKL